MLKVVSGKLEYGQLTQKYLKTSYSLLQTTNKHILNPNEDQLSNPTPSGHALYSSLHLLKLNKVKQKTAVPSTDQEDTDMNLSYIVTRKGRKYVQIQTTSPVPVANSNVQKERGSKIIDTLY